MRLSERVTILLLSLGLTSVNAAETVYFLVGEVARTPKEIRHNDSYVLPLSKQEDIDYARYLIVQNQLGFKEGDRTIAIARLVGGGDGINQNHVNPRFPQWSWHVGEFHQFAEIVAEVLDGNPTQIEQSNMPTGDERLIGFIDYTVVKELGPYPLYVSVLPQEPSVEFYWAGLGSNYVYTLETKDSLVNTNWIPIPGAIWPLRTNHWTLPRTNSATLFYRVRAEQPNP